eukprot:1271708-Amphidinium_carterae.1
MKATLTPHSSRSKLALRHHVDMVKNESHGIKNPGMIICSILQKCLHSKANRQEPTNPGMSN